MPDGGCGARPTMPTEYIPTLLRGKIYCIMPLLDTIRIGWPRPDALMDGTVPAWGGQGNMQT